MLYDVPLNYDQSGKLQHSLVCRDVVLCLCYQPPGVSYRHPNTGRGVASQAVYVVSGDYIMVPNYSLAPHITVESHPALHIKEGEIIDLEKYMNICTIDTAGENGVMMIHINPLSGIAEFNCDVIMNNQSIDLQVNDKRTIAFALKENVYINDLELSLLNRVRLKKNSIVSISTSDDGVCLILEKRIENEKIDELNADLIKNEESISKWSQYHKYKIHRDLMERNSGIYRQTVEFIENENNINSGRSGTDQENI